MSIKYTLALLLICSGCTTSRLAPGITYEAKPSGDVIITLQPGAAILIKEGPTNGALVCVGNVDGLMSFIQLAEGGKIPVSIDIKDGHPYRVTRTIHDGTNTTEYFDIDADGVPDLKLLFLKGQDGPTGFRRKSIEWEQEKSE